MSPFEMMICGLLAVIVVVQIWTLTQTAKLVGTVRGLNGSDGLVGEVRTLDGKVDKLTVVEVENSSCVRVLKSDVKELQDWRHNVRPT